ncbi:S8 family serine peptidase [Roseofilum casamattae]|uniref:S8 family serine peptidase n=1 Tax=Roseofilum casamattae BLCC-M143 TaxID=3022442 RepID=A0ABT7C2E1_9CYAN|nr:S8 family serine peptidase [Roseofilum casamattae]MDJ1185627.1 S8 family serine peptidase [Roseofilum casamattae BLCC-M143]
MNNEAENRSNRSPIAEENMGLVLQRGGEQLILEKARDRITVSPKPKAPADWARNLPSQATRPIGDGRAGSGHLSELTIDPQSLETAIGLARNSTDVAFASHVYQIANSPGTYTYLSDEITVQWSPGSDRATRETLINQHGLQVIKPIDSLPHTFVYQLTTRSTENPIKIANRLVSDAAVIAAEPNIIVPAQPLYRPRDGSYGQQWYLNHFGGQYLSSDSHIDAEKAWDITRGDRSIVVAVADDAIDMNHPDFQGLGKIVAPKDLKDEDPLPQPEGFAENHGTSCAGLAVAEENGSGIVGVAPGCSLMPVRTTGFLDDNSIEELFEWCVDRGASVISCSWGPASVNFPLSLRQNAAITKAATEGRQGKGCVIVFASGNSNRPINDTVLEQGWPNNVISGNTRWLAGFPIHPNVVAVSACSSLGKKAIYSNWGKEIAVCAPSNNAPPGIWLQQTGFIPTPPNVTGGTPGLGVFTTDRVGGAGYGTGDFTGGFGGTSSACPIVAGVAALVLSANPDLTAAQVKQILISNTDKITDAEPDPQFGFRKGTYDSSGHSEWFGYGKVNAYKAVSAAARSRPTIPVVSRWIQRQNYSSMNIPDYNSRGISSSLYISESNFLRDIQVTVDIAHSFLGDIQVTLIAPNGKTILLQNRTMGSQTTLRHTYTTGDRPLLKTLANLSIRGVWKLQVVDHALGSTGTLRGWVLTLGI